MAKTMIGIKPIHERVLVGIYDDGDKTIMLGGRRFILLDDTMLDKNRSLDKKHQGIRPRWAIVLAVSDTVQELGEIVVGNKVLLDELKWTRAIPANIHDTRGKIWSIPAEDILGIENTGFLPEDKEQISRLYPNWETWTVEEV